MLRIMMMLAGPMLLLALLPVAMADSLPPTPEGMCRCGLIGEHPMVVFYDNEGTALLIESHNYLLSFARYDRSLYPCSFVLFIRTFQPYNNTQLVVPQGVQLSLNQGLATTTFFTAYGVWNNGVPGYWLPNPNNYSDANIKVTGDGDGGYFLEPTLDTCHLRFYAKIDGIFSKFAVFVDKAEYGGHLDGLCGNCNDVVDEYDQLVGGETLDAPLRITENVIVARSYFPNNPNE